MTTATRTDAPCLPFALRYAEKGWRVFPCKPRGKTPLTAHGFEDATTDAGKIETWYRKWPNANVAVATGAVSNLVVIDIDAYKPGADEGFEDLEARFGALPDTYEVVTPRGGRHLYFTHPGGKIPSHEIVGGVDCKADGGYVVAPPSINEAGKPYLVEATTADDGRVPVPLPDRWVTFLRGERQATRQTPEAMGADRNGQDRTKALEALGQLSPWMVDDYDRWKDVGMILHTVGVSCDHWERWSEQSDLYKTGECARKWAGFTAGKGLGLGSLIDWAKESMQESGGANPEGNFEPPKPWVPFPTEVLPEPLRSFVRGVAKAMNVCESFVALPALAVCASCVGTARRARVNSTWTEPSVLWTAVIARSGATKSPPFELALKPLQSAEDDAHDTFDEAVKIHKRTVADYESRLAEWKKTGRKTGESQPVEPEEPTCVRMIVSDTTIEALAMTLAANPRGVLLGREELSGWFASFDQYRTKGGADVPAWLTLHGARTLCVDRKTGSHKNIRVRNACACVCGTTQPKILARCLSQDFFDSGLASRVLVAMPPRRRKKYPATELDQGTYDGYALLVRKLLAIEHLIDSSGRPVPADVPLSKAAHANYVKFYGEHAQRQHDCGDDDLVATFAKLEGGAVRFALIFHQIRKATGGADGEIGCEDINAGITLARWFCDETERVYAVLRENEGDTERNSLIEFIRSRGGKITPRELKAGNRKYRPTAVAREALDELVKAGLGSFAAPKPGKIGGRPSDVFCLEYGDPEGAVPETSPNEPNVGQRCNENGT